MKVERALTIESKDEYLYFKGQTILISTWQCVRMNKMDVKFFIIAECKYAIMNKNMHTNEVNICFRLQVERKKQERYGSRDSVLFLPADYSLHIF